MAVASNRVLFCAASEYIQNIPTWCARIEEKHVNILLGQKDFCQLLKYEIFLTRFCAHSKQVMLMEISKAADLEKPLNGSPYLSI